MSFTKIEEKDYNNKGIRIKNNPLGLPVAEAQRAFDEMALDVIIPKFNELSTQLDEFQIKGIRIYEGQIEVSLDGETWFAPADNKVDKIEGKGLSENDYTNEEKQKVSESYNIKHSHENKAVLDNIENYVITAIEEASFEAGSADMRKSVYDIENRNTDIFSYVDNQTGSLSQEVGEVLERIGEADDISPNTLMGKMNLPDSGLKFAQSNLTENKTLVWQKQIKPLTAGKGSVGCSAVSADGKIYFFLTNSIYAYNPDDCTYSLMLDLTGGQAVQFGAIPSSAVELGDTIFIVCGNNAASGNYADFLYAYSRSSNTLSSTAMTIGANTYATIVNVNGVIYLNRGTQLYKRNSNGTLASVGPANDSLKLQITACVVENKIWYFQNNTNIRLTFNTITNTWETENITALSTLPYAKGQPLYDSEQNIIYTIAATGTLSQLNLTDNTAVTGNIVFAAKNTSAFGLIKEDNTTMHIPYGDESAATNLYIRKVIFTFGSFSNIFCIYLKKGAKVETNGALYTASGHLIADNITPKDDLYYICQENREQQIPFWYSVY